MQFLQRRKKSLMHNGMIFSPHDPIVISINQLPPLDTNQLSEPIIARLNPNTYTEYDVRKHIVPSYLRWCAVACIDPRRALAQMLHETGWLSSWWCQRPVRHPLSTSVFHTPTNSGANAGVGVIAWSAQSLIQTCDNTGATKHKRSSCVAARSTEGKSTT